MRVLSRVCDHSRVSASICECGRSGDHRHGVRRVHDSTGGIISGATIVVTHGGTNLVRETVSDERGLFDDADLSGGLLSDALVARSDRRPRSRGSRDQGIGAAVEVLQRVAPVLEVTFGRTDNRPTRALREARPPE